jgi:hypothetical protein
MAAGTEGPRERALRPYHRQLLHDRAVGDDAIAARGYWTAMSVSELERLGFARVQCNVPALVIPLRGLDGDVVNYQIRPDTPRIDAERGRPIKYETPAASGVTLDVGGLAREHARGNCDLYLTEGAPKVDAATTAGLACIGVMGVWNWRTAVEGKVRTVLPDLLRIAWADRKVIVAYDSDCMDNPSVHAAMEKLAAWLEAQGAWVHTAVLPCLDGAKTGLDDFFAAGRTVSQLWEYVVDGVPRLELVPDQVVLPTAQLLGAVERFVARFVWFTPERRAHELTAVALWVLHTWAFDAATSTGYLYVRAPAKETGKTRLLEVLQLVCRNSLRASSISAAAIFQVIEAKRPTLLVDEVNAMFKGGQARTDAAEMVRQVLNGGHRAGDVVVRGSQDGEPKEFSTWCPKAMAGQENGALPDDVRSRCIVISLERKPRDTDVERLRAPLVAEPARELRERLHDWGIVAVDRLAEYRADDTPQITDRELDIWEPMLAIADDAGGDWPARARQAMLALAGADAGDRNDGLVLLGRLREVFDATESLSSREVVQALNGDEELPFSDYRQGKGISARGVSNLLRPFGIGPHVYRQGEDRARGYRRAQFEAVWERYLSPRTGSLPADLSVPSVTSLGLEPSDVTHGTDNTDGIEGACGRENGAAHDLDPDERDWLDLT